MAFVAKRGVTLTKSIVLFLFSVSTFAQDVSDELVLPESFSVECGDIGHKDPYDETDIMGALINIDITGEATKVESSKITGYWAGGKGYAIDLVVADATLTGTDTPENVPFVCYFGGKTEPITSPLTASMTCNSRLQKLGTVFGFNMIRAKLSLPLMNTVGKETRATGQISVRASKRVTSGNRKGERYGSVVRELQCRYTEKKDTMGAQ